MALNQLIERARSILLTPNITWPAIAAEPSTQGDIYKRYVLILAAIPAIFSFIDATVFGYTIPFAGTYRLGVGPALSSAVLAYGLSIVGVFVLTLIVNALAPTFGGEKNDVQALKAVAYAYTASWVAGIGEIVPYLSFLILLAGGIYSIYLLYVGLPHTMKCPKDKAVGYTAVTVVIGIVLSMVIGAVVGGIAGAGAMMSGFPAPGAESRSVKLDPDSSLGKLEKWGEQVEEAAERMEQAQKSGDAQAQSEALGTMLGTAMGGDANVESLAPLQIKGFLPETLAGMTRQAISAERNGAMGIQVSTGQARYVADGGSEIDVEITDMGGAHGMMALASWARFEAESETDTGYEKTYKEGGRIVHEEWNNDSQWGEYSVILGDRFIAKASGNAANINHLKAAVAGLDLTSIEALKEHGVKAN